MANKFIVGSRVKWVSVPREGNVRGAAIKCVGVVRSIKRSTFGGQRKDLGAVVSVSTKAYHERYGKDWAFVSFKRLEKA